MPEKSVREMSARERRHYSLAARVFHSTIIGTLIVGLVALVIGLGLYSYALVDQYINESYSISRSAAPILAEVVDVEPLASKVMEIYKSMSPEERAKTGTAEYRSRFAELENSSDAETVRKVLALMAENSDVNDIYLAMYDEQTSALVYIADPDPSPNTVCHTGDWEEADDEELAAFLNWDGESKLHYISNTERYGWICTGGVPVKNSAGQTVAFVLSDATLTDLAGATRRFVLQYSLAILAVMIIYGVLMSKHMQKKVVKPINDIADAAAGYVADKRSGAEATDRFASLNIKTGDEIEKLSLVMADMERDLTDYVEDLTAATAEKERLSTELELASRIQADMLPGVFPPFPDRKEFDIYASMTPAKEVGGDFYDFYFTDKDHLCMVMADVSGKGIPAALFMMGSKIIIKNLAMSGKSPAEVLKAMNDQICAANREDMFVTVWLGMLDLKTGVLKAANAGHEYPVIKQPGGRFEIFKDKHGFVVGGMPDVEYQEYELQLETGASIFLYTDGIPEAVNFTGEAFGTERMLDALNHADNIGPTELVCAMSSVVESFASGADQFDDITMLCLKYKGPVGPDRSGKETPVKTFKMPATLENLQAATEFINNELNAAGFPDKARRQVDIVVDEMFANISSYAYKPETGDITIDFNLEDEGRTAVISFKDQGTPFDPLAEPDPDTTLPADQREIGGLGILLIKKTMDYVSYRRENDTNILTVKKRI